MDQKLLNGWIDTSQQLPEVDQEVLGLVDLVKGKPMYLIAFTYKYSKGKEHYYFQVNADPSWYKVKEVKYWQPSPSKTVK